MQTSHSLRNIHEILNKKKIIKQQTTLFPTPIQDQSYPWIIILRFASFLLRKYQNSSPTHQANLLQPPCGGSGSQIRDKTCHIHISF